MNHRTSVPVFLFALAAFGCASPTDDADSRTNDNLEVESDQAALPRPGPPAVAGPAHFLLDVTRTELELGSDQKTRLVAIEAELDAASKPLELDRQSIDKRLALALRIGQLDATSTQNSIDDLARRVESGAPAQVRAIDALWETLDGSQRQAVAKSVRSLRPRPPLADPSSDRPLGPFFSGLELTTDQHAALLAVALPPRNDDPMEALLAAFENDGFRAEQVMNATDLGNHARKQLGQHLAMTQTLLRVLDDDQRSKLAKRMERAPT